MIKNALILILVLAPQECLQSKNSLYLTRRVSVFPSAQALLAGVQVEYLPGIHQGFFCIVQVLSD